MSEISGWKKKYDLKELELNALLEITQAVNNNLSSESLYKIYNFTLRANLKIKRLALYVKEEIFDCKTYFGTENDYSNVALNDYFLQISETKELKDMKEIAPFNEFDMVIPVTHKNDLLAFIFSKNMNEDGIEDEGPNTNFIQVLTNIIIVAIKNRKLVREQHRQEAELEIARNVQQYLFPKELPETENLKMFASYLPHQSVGGDYYDYIPVSKDKFIMCIADVSGKGIPAALLMSNFQASLRTLARQTDDLEKIIHELNYQTLQNGNGEHFITFFMALYDSSRKKLRYVNAGHNPPYLCSYKGKIQSLEVGTTILGSFPELPFLNVGKYDDLDKFYFFSYTDGLTETRNELDEEFGVDILESILLKHMDYELPTIHKKVIDSLDEFKGKENYQDDITIFSCRVNLSDKA